MKTVTYNEVLYRAAESAGRVRTALPASEATMLKSIIALELGEVWKEADWHFLIPNPLAVTVLTNANGEPYFSKNEGSTDPSAPELGDVFGVYTADPRNPNAQAVELAFDEGDNIVRLRPPEPTAPAWPLWQTSFNAVPSQVWVEYLLPDPDIMSLTGEALENYEIPTAFLPYLAARAAGHLLTADGATGMAGVQFGLAERYLDSERGRITRPEWRWKLRVRK